MSDTRRDVIVAVDQGTSSTKAVAVDRAGTVLGRGSVAIGQDHPLPGWVEQSADEIATSVAVAAAEAARQAAEAHGARVAGVALSTQRESAVVWDRETGEPLGPVLGWQDRRTADAARALGAAGHGERVRAVCGLPIDPMFSALKFAWLLDAVDPDRRLSGAGRIGVGTVDAWLAQRLTGEFRVEAGNASRTALLDLGALDWSDELLDLFRIPRAALPRVAASDQATEAVRGIDALPAGTRIHAVLGDSHAALFGHGARTPGAVKVTLGTGSSVMGLLAGREQAPAGLVTTVAWSLDAPSYAFEGNILSTGATLVWLAGLLGSTPEELIALAGAAGRGEAAHGVDLVPAFAGLGAPWWDEHAQAVLSGFDLGTSRAEVARAAVDSIALQIGDVLDAASSGGDRAGETVLVDGGPAANDVLVQRIADLTGRSVRRPGSAGLSALGAARLGGVSAGIWGDDDFGGDTAAELFRPAADPGWADARRRRWHSALDLARSAAPARTPQHQ
ncbi:FGGY family carbohydrate kinase [Leifsonia sp. NPDC058194]|uniref:FGGY family carbohydrate kinase n=1 Tax=Leifsonia sp. NPDC058194 TaxID=3346374 RepID=UPI0036DC94C1